MTENISFLDSGCVLAKNESGLSKYEFFVENRHDHSLLSVLLRVWGIKLYSASSQFDLYQKNKYKTECTNTDKKYETYIKSTYNMPILLHTCGNIRFAEAKG